MKRTPTNTRYVLGLLGPAFVAAIAYVDPGNFAANLSAGSQFGYTLLWVLVVANAMACLVQYLSAKLGIVTGMSLPEVVATRLPKKARISYWLQAELAAVATDIAEVLGGAIALQLLFDLPLIVGGLITGFVSLLLLLVQNKRRQSLFERITLGLLLIIPIGFVVGLFMQPPVIGDVMTGLIPHFDGADSILIATSMLGATVMPHVIYLHSALVRDRHGIIAPTKIKGLLRATKIDVGIAMVVAGGINISMLLLAASALYGLTGTDSLEGIYAALSDAVSPTVAVLFAVGLLASGLASTSVGCYAGSVIMDGLLQRRIPLLLRRIITLTPALLIILIGFDPTRALVISQVVLSFAIPFAVVPLVRITSSPEVMGSHANSRLIRRLAWLIVGLIVAINVVLIGLTIF